MQISVILATYKRPETLSRTLNSFSKFDIVNLQWEVIVVDNAGDPATKSIVADYSKRLPLEFYEERNKGKNIALNAAIKRAVGELLVFTDDDIIADQNWLLEMWEGSKRWPEFSIFGGRILPDFPPLKIPLPDGHPFYRQAYSVADWKLEEGPYEVNKVWGANMAIRSEIFSSGWSFNPEIGPKGNNYIMGSESELTTRLYKAGFRPVYLPDSLVLHQIQPEQLRYNWLFGRAFRYGRSDARKKDSKNLLTIFGVPIYLVKEMMKDLIKLPIISFVSRKKALNLMLRHHRIRGTIYQYRKDYIEDLL